MPSRRNLETGSSFAASPVLTLASPFWGGFFYFGHTQDIRNSYTNGSLQEIADFLHKIPKFF
jgi:hypothetical protein